MKLNENVVTKLLVESPENRIKLLSLLEKDDDDELGTLEVIVETIAQCQIENPEYNELFPVMKKLNDRKRRDAIVKLTDLVNQHDRIRLKL